MRRVVTVDTTGATTRAAREPTRLRFDDHGTTKYHSSGCNRAAGKAIRHANVFGRCTRNQRRSIATCQTRYQLNTGASIPAISFGTFQNLIAQEDAVARALQIGMRLIDTASVYDVEKQIGRGMKRSGIPREEIFLGTKLWYSSYYPDDVERALDESLADLDTPYFDVFLMHYPCTFARGEARFPPAEMRR